MGPLEFAKPLPPQLLFLRNRTLPILYTEEAMASGMGALPLETCSYLLKKNTFKKA